MDQILDRQLADSEIKFEIRPEGEFRPTAGQKNKLFNDLTEAFEAFDNLDDEKPIPFLVKSEIAEKVEKVPGTFFGAIELPPIPPQNEVDDYFLKNALLLVDAGEFQLARNLLADVLRRDADHVEAIRWMGWCFKQDGDLNNALTCYEQLVKRRLTDQDLFELGEIQYALKQDAEARDTWLDALIQCDAESPRLFDIYKNLGNVFTRLSDFDSAEENYNKALTLKPQSDILQVNLGAMNYQRHSYRESLEHFKKGLELNPYNDRAWCGVALVAREMKDNAWANSVLLKSLDINPLNETALEVVAHWALADGSYDEAIRRLEIYLEQHFEDAAVIFQLARLHTAKGQFNSAELELEKVLAFDPQHSGAIELMTLIRHHRGV